MIGAADLLQAAPGARRVPPTAVARRVVALVILAVGSLAAATGLRALAWTEPPPPVRLADAEPAPGHGVAPSALVARAAGSPWHLIDLGLRADGEGPAVITARFEAPAGAPALPDRLLASLGSDLLTGIVPVAVTATATGTSVEVAGRMTVDRRPRPGTVVDEALVPLRISDLVTAAGGRPRSIRAVTVERGPAAHAVSFTAGASEVVAVLVALEDGPTAPARITSLRVAREGEGFSVDLVLTARTRPERIPAAAAGAAPGPRRERGRP
jgi:hypothetical protein